MNLHLMVCCLQECPLHHQHLAVDIFPLCLPLPHLPQYEYPSSLEVNWMPLRICHALADGPEGSSQECGSSAFLIGWEQQDQQPCSMEQ